MIGDGISTNMAAATQVLACLREKGLANNSRYFLILVKCGSHQVALSAKYGVVGSAASAAATAPTAPESVTATAVRLFKYLLSDYYEEFVKSTCRWTQKMRMSFLPQWH